MDKKGIAAYLGITLVLSWAIQLLALYVHAASAAYWIGTNARRMAFDAGIASSRKAGCPVISIGNLTVGGTGKTPTVIFLANLLKEQGRQPAGHGSDRSQEQARGLAPTARARPQSGGQQCRASARGARLTR